MEWHNSVQFHSLWRHPLILHWSHFHQLHIPSHRIPILNIKEKSSCAHVYIHVYINTLCKIWKQLMSINMEQINKLNYTHLTRYCGIFLRIDAVAFVVISIAKIQTESVLLPSWVLIHHYTRFLKASSIHILILKNIIQNLSCVSSQPLFITCTTRTRLNQWNQSFKTTSHAILLCLSQNSQHIHGQQYLLTTCSHHNLLLFGKTFASTASLFTHKDK